jgi:hypothetical protein
VSLPTTSAEEAQKAVAQAFHVVTLLADVHKGTAQQRALDALAEAYEAVQLLPLGP